MCHRCALSTALGPLSPPPPNISRLGSIVNHIDRFNVRRGGRRKAEMAKNPCLIRGLISGNLEQKLRFTRCRNTHATQHGEGCREERRAGCALRCQARAVGTVASGTIGFMALGERRGRKFAGAANTCGRTMSWAANSGGVRTHRHHRHARLSSAFANALRGHAVARAIIIAEAQWRTVAAVAVA